jgi:hypothetical protein
MSGSSVSLTTSLSRIFFWSKSKIPPQFGGAAVYVVETFRDEIDALCFHGVLRERLGYADYTGWVQPTADLQC